MDIFQNWQNLTNSRKTHACAFKKYVVLRSYINNAIVKAISDEDKLEENAGHLGTCQKHNIKTWRLVKTFALSHVHIH